MESCAFDILFTKSVPHILEKIFLSLDYESLKECCEVSKAWNKLFMSESFKRKAKSVFCKEIAEDQITVFWAVANSNADEIKRLLSGGFVDVNYWYDGYSYMDSFKIFKYMDSYGYPNSQRLLSKAAINGRQDVVKILLEEGADYEKANIWEETPLYFAAWLQHLDVAKVLMDAGANPNRADRYGCTPQFKGTRALSDRRTMH